MRTDDDHIAQECLNGESGAFGVLVDKYRVASTPHKGIC